MKMYTRSQPYLSFIQERELLTQTTSTKKTYHIVLNIEGGDFPYKVGDSIGTLPSNDPEEVHHILQKIGSGGEEEVLDPRSQEMVSIRYFLTHRANLAKVNRSFLTILLEKGESQWRPLLESEERDSLNALLHTHTLFELLHPAITPAEIARTCLPLLPRFYSIANSAKVFPGEIHLLVAYVQYLSRGQTRRGVGSHFLCDLAQIGKTPVPLYLQPSNHFTLPADPDQSIILIGPGTGVAPYRAFLQERMATQATGRNWLFFGERNRASDFYYESYWTSLEKQGRLRLDLAFSRDGLEKRYVQHAMYERRKSLWEWIDAGAFVYVCGSAGEMAKDVEAMLQKIIQEEGNFSEESAFHYVKKMRQEKRYLMDVY